MLTIAKKPCKLLSHSVFSSFATLLFQDI